MTAIDIIEITIAVIVLIPLLREAFSKKGG